MFEQTTLKNGENYTIQNPERTLTTFVDSRRKIDQVINNPKELPNYIKKGIMEWVQGMKVTLGMMLFISPTEEILPEAYVTHFRKKMADFFKKNEIPENLLLNREKVEENLSRLDKTQQKELGNFQFKDILSNQKKKVEENLLELDATQKEKLANFLLLALNVNEPGLLHASSAFLANGFLMTGDDYKIEGCRELTIKWTSKRIYFETSGVIKDSKDKISMGGFVYNGFVNIEGGKICIQDYLKFTSYDKHLTSSLEHIIRLFKLPRENIYEILGDLISQPKECNINEVSILIRELIYRIYQELLKISKDYNKEDSAQYVSHLVTWLDRKDGNDKQNRKNKFWWVVERRLQDFSKTYHLILCEGYKITEENILGKDIIDILGQAILRKVMVNIFNDYKSIFFELVTAIESKTKLEIPQNLVNEAELSKDRFLNPLRISPNDVIEYYRSKIVAFLDSCKEKLELNSNRNNGIWFFKFFNLTPPLKKYIDEKQEETANIMDIFAKKGDYHLFIVPEQNNSSQVSDETLSRLIKML